MRICISIGEYTTNAYVVPGIELPACCIEELCYLIRENAVLLDQEFMSKALVDWIRLECALPGLADALLPMVQKSGTLSGFAGTILEYAGLYDEEEIRETIRVLQSGAGLSGIEKHKQQMDSLVRSKKYRLAIRGYQSLIRKWEEIRTNDESQLPAIHVLAGMYHNMGVAYAGLMNYHMAAEAFHHAGAIEEDEKDHQMAYLAAKRLELSDSEYVALAADHLGQFRNSMVLEKTMDALNKTWEAQPEYERLMERHNLAGAESESYFEENERIVAGLMESYRESVGD